MAGDSSRTTGDVSTARFMKRFYSYLRNGKPKDEALRAAQIDQIREKSRASPPSTGRPSSSSATGGDSRVPDLERIL